MERMEEPEKMLDDLIVKAAACDRPALESLLLHFYDPLLSYVRKLFSRDIGVAPEDVVQVTMIEAFQRIWSLDAQGGDAFFAWLKTIARSRIANMIEARRAQKRGGDRKPITRLADTEGVERSILRLIASPQRTPSLIARRKEASDALKLALSRLDKERRELMTLRYGQGLSYQEIALLEGKTVAAVKMHIHRTLSRNCAIL
jgi:RNA polymerase sigma factor (sigma-70 family)